MAAESLRVEEGLQEAKNPISAEAKLGAGTAEFERVPGTDVQTGMARSRTAVTLPSDGENEAMHMGMEEVADGDQSLLVSPVWSMYGRHRGQMGENGEGWVPILEGDGTQLLDEDGTCIYEEPGWHVMRDQNGYILWDQEGELCFEETDEDQLAIWTRSLHKQVPVTAAQMDSMAEQNQQLQMELDWSQFAH